MNLRHTILMALLGLTLVAGPGVPQVRAAATATDEVKQVLDEAMDIQTRPDLEGEQHRAERVRQIRKVISQNFLSADMAKESIKEQWDKLNAKQRSEFQALFAELFQDSYTRMVINFLQRESIEYRGESDDDGGKLVKTEIMRANEHIPVDYHLIQTGGQWRIRDVEIDGVSIVENYRNTFRRIILTGSVESLIAKLRTQSQAIRSGGTADK